MPRYSGYGQLDSVVGEEADINFFRVNARLRPDQLQPGELASSINGRMGVDGSWQVRKGHNAFGPGLTTGEAELTLPFYLYANRTISAASRTGSTVTITTSVAHEFVDQTVVFIDDVTGTVDPQGNRLITVTGANTFTFTITGAVGNETYTLGGTPIAGAPALSASVTAAYGSCLFSDPSDENAEYIIIATNQNAQAISLADASATTINYPSGLTVTGTCELIQAFDKVLLLQGGITSWEWNGDLTGTPAFTKVQNGDYQVDPYLNASNNTTITDGVVSVAETGHGLAVGDRIFVVSNGTTDLLEDGDGYLVATVPNANSFTFYAQVADHNATTVVYSKKIPRGAGFSHLPAPPWAVYHQRRLWVPWWYTTTGTSGSEVITDREVRDEILISDVLDYNTFDKLINQFRVTAGTADYLVGLHPFTEDNMVAFNRNSIHLITGVSGPVDDIQIRLVTREAGLVARKSVVQIANSVFFLSDNGVYATDFGDEYNLRGAGLPLSDPIQPIIDRINSQYAENAVAIYHDNRYWIAVPLDDSTVNNAILVYNLLNKGWESVDLIDDPGWNITNLIVAGAGGVNKLYAVNLDGGVHVLCDREDDVDLLGLVPGLPPSARAIESEIITRRFILGTISRKNFKEFELQVESSDTNDSNATISGIAENVDNDFQINTISGLNGGVLPVGEDASLRGRIGQRRAYGLQLKITPTAGRPKVRAVRVTGNKTFESLQKAT